jgi:hypothetical protein
VNANASDHQLGLVEALRSVIALRTRIAADPALSQRWIALKTWQSGRLRRTYADLFAQRRYQPAGEFFLTDIYGPKDFSQRDSEALRVVPKLARMLPAKAVETLREAVELDVLSETLDSRVAELVVLPIDDAGYCRAYRSAGTEAERRHQIEVIDRIGRSLEKLARIPLLAGMLHLMRRPAEAAGVGHLHAFLQNGFDAFKAMGPAGEFLSTLKRREIWLMEQMLAGATPPFDARDVPAR